MNALQQYALLVGMVVATVGLVLSVAVIAKSISRVRGERAKDVPSPRPAATGPTGAAAATAANAPVAAGDP